MRAEIAVYDGVDELDVVGPLRVLRAAAGMGAALGVRVVTRTPTPVITAHHGLRLQPDGVLSREADLVLVPGGGWVDRSDRGAWGEVRRGEWTPLLREAAWRGATLAGVCTGTMLLAHAGVVGRRRATTHRAARADLAALGATVVDERVVDDGDLITCAGVTSGIDLALWLVARAAGEELAGRVADAIEYPWSHPGAAPDRWPATGPGEARGDGVAPEEAAGRPGPEAETATRAVGDAGAGEGAAPPPGIEVRPARPGDVAALLELYRQLAEGFGHQPASPGRAGAILAEISRQPDRTLLVVVCDGQVVGTADLIVVRPSLTHEGRPWAAIENVVVDGRARRRGAGRALMEEAIRHAREQGCHRVQLLSNNRRTEAHAFYRALGFESSAQGFRLQPL